MARAQQLPLSLVAPATLFALSAGLLGCGSGTVKKQGMDEALAAPKPVRAPQIDFLDKQPIGNPPGTDPPWITHLAITDLDGNGLKDVIFSDARAEAVCWLAQDPAGTYTEKVLGDPIKGPTHLAASDIDRDGDLDILVASMGNIFPTNDPIGAVIVLENDGHQHFTNQYVAEGIPRVTDVEPGDFDGDGDTDFAVGQFGYETGKVSWMENIGDGWIFRNHALLNLSGTIHTPVADIDQDGDLDIVALVSQEWEEIHVFENDGKGAFASTMVYGSTNEDFGSSGISLADLDGDGDLDLLYTNGDSFDYLPPGPRPWHGLQWLENRGRLRFDYHRIDDFSGAASAQAADVDKDGDLDIVVSSSLGQDEHSAGAVMVWFENDGAMSFTRRDISRDPSHLVVIARGDMDGDGWTDFVSGGLYAFPPYDRLSRITLWHNRWPDRSPAGAKGDMP